MRKGLRITAFSILVFCCGWAFASKPAASNGDYYVTIKNGQIALDGERPMTFEEFPAYLRMRKVKRILLHKATPDEWLCIQAIAGAANVSYGQLMPNDMIKVNISSDVRDNVEDQCKSLESKKAETQLPYELAISNIFSSKRAELDELDAQFVRDSDLVKIWTNKNGELTQFDQRTGEGPLTPERSALFAPLLKDLELNNFHLGYDDTSSDLPDVTKQGNRFQVKLRHLDKLDGKFTDCSNADLSVLAGHCRIRLSGGWVLDYNWKDDRLVPHGDRSASSFLPIQMSRFFTGDAKFSHPYTLDELEEANTKANESGGKGDWGPALEFDKSSWADFKKEHIRAGDKFVAFYSRARFSSVARLFGAAGVAVLRDGMVVAVFSNGDFVC